MNQVSAAIIIEHGGLQAVDIPSFPCRGGSEQPFAA